MFQTRSPIRTIAIVAGALAALLVGASAVIPNAAAIATVSAPTTALTEVMAITGGADQNVDEYPYMATVRVGGFFCGGTLIAPDWVLTASHCAPAGTDPRGVRVQLGVRDTWEDPGVAFPVERVVAHDVADLTLLHLAEVVEDFRPIALASEEMANLWEPNTTGWAIGWGKTAEGDMLSRGLHGAQLDFVPDSSCTSPDDPTIVCAGGTGTGVCQGDSGGPIIVEADGIATEVGVTSYGAFCGSAAGFVEIAHYRDWISQTMGENAGISAQISTSCQNGDSTTAVEVANDAPYAKSVTVRLDGAEDQIIAIPPHGVASAKVSGRPKGSYPASVLLDGAVVANLSEVVDCSYSAEFSYRCIAGDGAFDARITNNEDRSTKFDFVVDTIKRSVTLGANDSERLTVSGRKDGYYKLKLSRDGVVAKEELIAVDCDPPEPEVSVSSSCLAGRGRVDVFLHNDTDETQTYTVAVGQLSERLSSVTPSGRSRITATGRPDGKLSVFVQRGDGNLTIRNVTVSCASAAPKPIAIAQSCLAGDGRIDVMLANNDRNAAEFVVTVGDLAARVRRIQAAMSDRVVVTGRPDGPISVVVTQNGTEVYADDVDVTCD